MSKKQPQPFNFSERDKDLLFVSQGHLLPFMSEFKVNEITHGLDWNKFDNLRLALTAGKIKEESRQLAKNTRT